MNAHSLMWQIGQDQGPLGHDPLLTKYPTLQTLNLTEFNAVRQVAADERAAGKSEGVSGAVKIAALAGTGLALWWFLK